MEAQLSGSWSLPGRRGVWAFIGMLAALLVAPGMAEDGQSKLFAQSASEQLRLNFDHRDLSWLLVDVEGKVVARNWNDASMAVAPGSLVKPFIAVMYGEQHNGVFPHVHCAGTRDRCWLPKGHGTRGLEDAIAVSCNAYFVALARGLDRNRGEETLRRFGLRGPSRDASDESLIGLGNGWRETPMALANAYLRLTAGPEQDAQRRILAGMKASAESGTAHGVDEALGVNAALAKTGTAVCAHHPRGAADGFAVVLYPADQPRVLLLVRKHGATGAETAVVAGTMLRAIGMGNQ
jgi:cell division protein FtsI/penicillin-binding protein 2